MTDPTTTEHPFPHPKTAELAELARVARAAAEMKSRHVDKLRGAALDAELEAERLAELAELADSEAFYAADKLSAERRWFVEGESRETELLAIIESLGHKVEKDLQSPPEWAAFKGAEAELKALSRFLRTMRSRGW